MNEGWKESKIKNYSSLAIYFQDLVTVFSVTECMLIQSQ
jgi:hypothetical protein